MINLFNYDTIPLYGRYLKQVGDNLRESIWGYAVIVLGVIAIGIIWFMANVTRTDQHNYNLLKETVEASMFDALDLAAYRKDGTIRIEEEKFIESFLLRFSKNADKSNEYKVEIFNVVETPPKVSLRVGSRKTTSMVSEGNHAQTEEFTFNVDNHIDAILETKY